MFILPGRHHIVYTSGVNERYRASWTRMSLWQCDTICTLPGWQSLNLIVPVALYQLHCYVSQHPFIRIKAVCAIRCVFFSNFHFHRYFSKESLWKQSNHNGVALFQVFKQNYEVALPRNVQNMKMHCNFDFDSSTFAGGKTRSDGGLVEAWGLSGAKQTAPAKSMNNVYLLGESVPGNATMCAL